MRHFSLLCPPCIRVEQEQAPGNTRVCVVSGTRRCQSREYIGFSLYQVDRYRIDYDAGSLCLPALWKELPAIWVYFVRQYIGRTQPSVRLVQLISRRIRWC